MNTIKNRAGRAGGSIWASGVMAGDFFDAHIGEAEDDAINISMLPGAVKDPSASGVPENEIQAYGYTVRADQGCSSQLCESTNNCPTVNYCQSYQVCKSVQDCPNIKPM